MAKKVVSRVKAIEFLTDDTLLLSIDSESFHFEPGQYVILSIPGDKESREYSIYNSPGENHVQFLIKIVKDGHLTSKLKNLKKNDLIEMEGLFGFFTLPNENRQKHNLIFVSTGTGISPIHSIISSYPTINHKVIHGVRTSDEKYHFTDYKPANYQSCISGNSTSEFQGRVTDYLKTIILPINTSYYLSGNSAMINDVTNFLLSRDVAMNQINTEIYF